MTAQINNSLSVASQNYEVHVIMNLGNGWLGTNLGKEMEIQARGLKLRSHKQIFFLFGWLTVNAYTW